MGHLVPKSAKSYKVLLNLFRQQELAQLPMCLVMLRLKPRVAKSARGMNYRIQQINSNNIAELSTCLRPSRHRAVERRPQRANDLTGDPKKCELVARVL